VHEKLGQIIASCSPSLMLTTSEYVTALEAGKAYCETAGTADKPTSGGAAAAAPFDVYAASVSPAVSHTWRRSLTRSCVTHPCASFAPPLADKPD